MSASLVKMGPVSIQDENGKMFRFTPQGEVVEVGSADEWYTRSHRDNPIRRSTPGGSQGGRIIVGFNVGIKEKWKVDDIVKLVYKIRRKQVEDAIKVKDAFPHPQGGDVGITFLTQMGIWQTVRDKKAYPERGAQVIIMNIIREKKARFRKDMVDIAEEMVVRLKQNAVIVEMSNKGVVTETIEVGP